jgi:hypothetical protein
MIEEEMRFKLISLEYDSTEFVEVQRTRGVPHARAGSTVLHTIIAGSPRNRKSSYFPTFDFPHIIEFETRV